MVYTCVQTSCTHPFITLATYTYKHVLFHYLGNRLDVPSKLEGWSKKTQLILLWRTTVCVCLPLLNASPTLVHIASVYTNLLRTM